MSTLGDILTINLTTRQITRLPIGEDVARQYMGGRGLNVWQMQQQANLDVDPFGPDNELLLSNGLLTGTVAPSSSRVQLAARSPQTGFLGTSNVGGHFGAALRRVGVQMVRVIGQSPAPVYLWIDGEKTEILDASSVWGLDVPAAVDAVKARHPDHPDLHFFGIGVGGENKVRFAAVIADDGHAAGRTGLGAVMGAKNLKAFVVPATPGSRSNNAELSDLAKDYAREIRASERYDIYSTYSNGVYLRETNDLGLLGTRNFQQVQFEKTDQ
ncbi:MAG: hypothetical protein HY866_08480, partial [Chloroflexi bacterium]|nr:hypothetical protein [Chloroflexota bacterium]